MAADGCVVVVGGNRGIGREIARHYADAGHEVVVTCTDAGRAAEAASEIGGRTTGIGLDLTRAHGDRGGAGVGRPGPLPGDGGHRPRRQPGPRLRASNARSTWSRSSSSATRRSSTPCWTASTTSSSIVLFGGLAKDRPYPGSTTVSTVNGGIVGLVRTLV